MSNPTCITAAGAAPRLLPALTGRLAEVVGRLPIFRQALIAAYGHRFNHASGQVRMFRGVYPDFAAARHAIPIGRIEGWDNEPCAHRVSHERLRVLALDYPIMFWLGKLLPDCSLLFDWGGNVGISYFAYRKYIEYSPDLIWLVNDVATVVRLGGMAASEEEARGLRFTDSLNDLADADVLLAAGSLHFIEDPFSALRHADKLPRHILLNKVPAYDLPAAVTLQNLGTAFCPNHLFNRNEFLQGFERLGYRLVDEWKSPDLSCRIPFFPRHSIPAYSGFYLRRPV